jgi:hypothetical protein
MNSRDENQVLVLVGQAVSPVSAERKLGGKAEAMPHVLV